MKNIKDDKIQKILNDIETVLSEKYVPFHYDEEASDMGFLYGEHPKCLYKITRKKGRDTKTYILPICNRAGIEDKKVIDFSIKVVRSLLSQQDDMGFDVNELNKTLELLQHKRDSLATRMASQSMGEDQYRKYIISKALDYFQLNN